jgi:hypothetical protein
VRPREREPSALAACPAHARRAAVNENLSPDEVYAQFDGDQARPARGAWLPLLVRAPLTKPCPDS